MDLDGRVVSGLKRVDASEMEDGDDDKIDGAYTPDMLYTLGPTGVPVYAEVSTANNPNAAPRAPRDMPTTDGILVRGPMGKTIDDYDNYYFILADKIPKRKDGKNRYANFTNGKLVKDKNSEHIFVSADGPRLDAPVQLNELQKLLVESNVACAAEIGPKGMCEMRAISGAQKSADAPIGVVVTENGKAYFCQVGGAPLGAGETAQYLATYDKNAPPGAVLAKVLIKDGKAQPYTPAQAANMKNEKFRGIVVMGNKRQPVYVPGANPTEAEIKAADAATKSKLAGTSVDQAKLAIKESEGDAASVEFMNANEGFRQSSVFMYKNKGGAPGAGAAGGGGAAVAKGAEGCPPGTGPGDVRSVAFGMNGYQYEPQSKYLNR
ncbi:hypothetical protein WR25_01547 [Diploscapter pachys]|uniref:Uncharacterized protein n=1 Tax=Diploscapter pachys TaxID=2018661 RepID=A0A2A2K5H0_9BILA|nr:hypothetical protein WR25_01547 [Diploscapter pachys]